ncbi:SDR family NAD(P)-dependent oxidoreductase [Peptoniphilus stercorisuis]|uniref:Gluconate 5-dehydrogenase n=1 Tax=Peptoniphilus stercorisuis TaxID=1436965 RepID=A0ABS4KEH2_9FIRM|nr:glucose 1-dehydrogenase [Peptoniphilus stercorisuis]MBP2026168.1 gluconate 5-dehydrogenase [Peptoniphilus stercorisuis]
MFDLKGKVAVITGASSGLGADAAIAYAKSGANVALLARRIEKLENVAEEIKKLGVEVIAVKCDVSNEESVKKAVEEVLNKFGKIDILLNNAGVAVRGDVVNLKEDEWDRSFNTNVKGIYLMSKYVIPNMQKNKYGKIVNVASINAVIGDKQDIFVRHSYNASKSAVVGLTMGMATYYGKDNITVNAVGPGLFESEMTESTLFKSDDFMKMYSAQNPMSRAGKRGELNGPILFLSSDESSYVNGQFIVVDGGIKFV